MNERPLISCPGDRPPPHPGGTDAQLVDVAERDGGPHRAWEPVVADLRAEQALGRVAAADPAAAALLLLGACERLVLVELRTGPDTLPFRDRPDPAPELVATLLAGLDPGPGRQPSAPTDTETRP